MAAHGTVDEYLAAVPSDEAREALMELRSLIKEIVPDAQECISYGIPSYKRKGYLCGFAAFKNHCSFFPGGTVQDYADQLQDYKISKGTIQFQPDKPIPSSLLRTIILARVAEFEARK